MKQTKLKLRKGVKVILLVILAIVSYIYASTNGEIATQSTIGAIKIVLAWLAIPSSLVAISVITDSDK